MIIRVSSVSLSQKTSFVTRIEVIDDGCGLPVGEMVGFGMKNMKQRAENIGADISITSNDKGTIVCLELLS